MLSTRELACVRGHRTLFRGLNLRVERGAWLHVRGANGTGKTSLLRMLAGLTPPAHGGVYWQETLVTAPDSDYRRHLMYFGHQGALKEDLTALENLVYAAAIDGDSPDAASLMLALRRLGLRGREDLPVRVLSAGQRRRVMLARLLCRHAPLWILDEPFTALDSGAVELLCALLAEHVRAGGLAVLTSHQEIPLDGGHSVSLDVTGSAVGLAELAA